MNLDELHALLDIKSPSEFVYFEQFADLMEEPQDIPAETLAELTEEMDGGTLNDLVTGYFEEVLKYVPDGEDELYTLLTNIGTTLGTLASQIESDTMGTFAEELYRFRTWYLFESRVLCTELNEGTENELSLFAALTNYRVQNISGEEYEFDFIDALDFPLEEYIVSMDSIMEDDYGDGSYEEDDCYCDKGDDRDD